MAAIGRALLFATYATLRAVGPSDAMAVDVKSPAFQSPRVHAAARGWKEPWPRFDCATGLFAEIGSGLLFANLETAAVSPIGPRLRIGPELRFGMNSGATPTATVRP